MLDNFMLVKGLTQKDQHDAWVARAYLLELDSSFELCVKAMERAIELTADPRSRDYLRKKCWRVLETLQRLQIQP